MGYMARFMIELPDDVWDWYVAKAKEERRQPREQIAYMLMQIKREAERQEAAAGGE